MRLLASTMLLFLAASAVPAYAYLDPGTGSILLQGIIGAIAVAGAGLTRYWAKVRSVFKSSSPRKG